MPEKFVYVFIAGITLLLLASIWLGKAPLYSEGERVIQFAPWDVLFSSEQIKLNADNEQSLKHYGFGTFSVGYSTYLTSIQSEESITIKNGLFSDAIKQFNFEKNKANIAVLSFVVSETNSYGNLTVSLNNKIIFNEKATPKNYKITLIDLKEENIIKIEATSSGFKIWAPTTYILNSVDLSSEMEEMKEQKEEFYLEKHEFDGYNSGKLAFQVINSSDDENLIIELNGEEIYNDLPQVTYPIEIPFTKTSPILKEGGNYLILKSLNKGHYSLKNVELTIFFYEQGVPSKQSFTFGTTKRTYDRLQDKIIQLQFDLSGTKKSNLIILLNDNEIEYKMKDGPNVIDVKPSYFRAGTNVIEFKSYSTYTLENVVLGVVK